VASASIAERIGVVGLLVLLQPKTVHTIIKQTIKIKNILMKNTSMNNELD
jgi:hypothetical protein